MRIVRLIADFRLTELRLNRSLTFGAPLEQTVHLTRHASDLMDRIEGLAPECEAELRAKVDFFLHRARARVAGSQAFRDLRIALDLLAGKCIRRSCCEPAAVARERELIDRMLNRTTDASAIGDIVNGATIRCSLYSPDHQVMAFSRPNAIFYTLPRRKIIGRHIAELVGSHRYLTRARGRMERAMGGERQLYTYPLDLPGIGLRVMECEMAPMRASDGATAGIVMMLDDVSERFGL
ncbi:PAS domain-containing protein [Oceaniglobus indicus]|uniref:PAS domain-containing protein n=1 Tax=Oceaniglobus indicus TaxID=2047749 RepID=UPI000C1A4BE4|nr:PAS domain-containing protein [Oceaniglobus indicus]